MGIDVGILCYGIKNASSGPGALFAPSTVAFELASFDLC